MRPVIVLAAILPLAGLGQHSGDEATVVLDLGSWCIFLADFAVHLRFRPHYLRGAGASSIWRS